MNADTEKSMCDISYTTNDYHSGGLKKVGLLLLSTIQLIPLLEGWISYLLGSIIASLFTPISFLSLLWYPLDVVFKYIWMGCDWMKHKLSGQSFTWDFSSRQWSSHFPDF